MLFAGASSSSGVGPYISPPSSSSAAAATPPTILQSPLDEAFEEIATAEGRKRKEDHKSEHTQCETDVHDEPPSDDLNEEGTRRKKRRLDRIQLIKASVHQVLAGFLRNGAPGVAQLCDREVITEIITRLRQEVRGKASKETRA